MFSIARNVISGNSHLRPDEVAVPEAIARQLYIAEYVQEDNIERLMPYFLNGRNQYPGSSRVQRASGAFYDVTGLRSIEPGDVLFRNPVDGDLVNFNRQPSLTMSAVGTHVLKVLPEPPAPPDGGVSGPLIGKTFQMNVASTPLYNADFDGDQMSIWPMGNPASDAEAWALTLIHNVFISVTDAAPMIGQVQDSVVGSWLMTRNKFARMDKTTCMSLFQDTGLPFPDFSAGRVWSGWEAASLLLEKFPISFEKDAKWFNESFAMFLRYRPEDCRVRISKGRMTEGVLDKASVGDSSGGIFHRISRMYTSRDALAMVFALQQMAVKFVEQFGFSISVADLVLPAAQQRDVGSIVGDMLRESEEINRQLLRGQLVPPLGMSTLQFFETKQLSVLGTPDALLRPLLTAIDPDTNGLFQMIASGSKGKLPNMFNIMGFVGQTTLNSRRIEPGPGGRTLACFPRGDLSPQSHGFATSSYITGLSPSETFFGAIGARSDLTSKALSMSETGTANRNAVMNLQSMVADTLRSVRSGKHVAQLLYGEDGMDVRQLERVRLRTAEASDAEVLELASGDEGEAAKLREGRDLYRHTFMRAEQTNTSVVFSNSVHVAANVCAIAEEVASATHRKAAGDLSALRAAVGKFCDEIALIYVRPLPGEDISEVHLKFPQFALAGTLQRIVLRAELCSQRLAKLQLSQDDLGVVLRTVRLHMHRALVNPGEAVGVHAAQSVSAPLTQYMLDSHHRSVAGGTSKSGIERPKEIFGARPPSREKSSEMTFMVAGAGADRAALQKLADSVKTLELRQVLENSQLLYEDFDTADPVYPEDGAWTQEYLKYQPLLEVPGDLTRWCLRVEFSKLNLVMKSITLEAVMAQLRLLFPHTFIVHSPETSKAVIARICLRNAAMKKSRATGVADQEFSHTEELKAVATAELMLGAVLRGVRRVKDARVIERTMAEVAPDGSIRHVQRLAIHTVGSNLHGLLRLPGVIPGSVITSSIGETLEMFGIEACRKKIVDEIRNVMGGSCPNMHHLLVYADQLCLTGAYTSFERGGNKARERNNILLRSGTSAPLVTLTEAAENRTENPIYGIAAPMCVGTIPQIGTFGNRYVVNEEFVRAHHKNVSQILDDL
ncbi:MAG: hypothetical protein P1U53_15185 [Sulfitobacter sp.]|nr:hypothetical protein [Sulfitobacter sp.]